MKLHTHAEIMADICAFEGVTVKLNPDNPRFIERVHFLKLYSEQYPKPMGENATVNQLLSRVQEFLADEEIGVLPFDRSPMEFADEEDEDFVVIYRVIKTHDNQPHMEFIEATNDRDRMSHYLSRESTETLLAVVFIHDGSVSYYNRNTN